MAEVNAYQGYIAYKKYQETNDVADRDTAIVNFVLMSLEILGALLLGALDYRAEKASAIVLSPEMTALGLGGLSGFHQIASLPSSSGSARTSSTSF